MFDASRFGQFIPGNSLLHRLDPRAKMICLILYLTVLLMIRTPIAMLILLVGSGIVAALSRLSVKDLFGSLKPLLPILLFAFILNLFMPGEKDNLIFAWKFLKISRESLTSAVLISFRVGALVLLSNLFLSLTTSAMQMTDGFATLMKPLSYIGVPVQDIAMMMSIALRFVPILLEETDKIMKAQTSRGADYDTGGVIKRVKGFVTVLVPLFISAFRRADALAQAMEARAYRSGAKRGKLHPLKYQKEDYAFFAFTVLFLAAVLFLDFSRR